MSEPREVYGLGGQKVTINDEGKELNDVEAARLRADKKARFVRVLDRGFTVDRMAVPDLPKNLHGEWVALDQVERAEVLGFVVDTEYAPKRQLHPHADGAAHIGDAIFMVQAMEDHELYEEVRAEQYIRQHGSPAQQKRLGQQEETEYKNVVEKQVGLPVVDESLERQVRKDEIKEAIDAQTQAKTLQSMNK